MEPQKQDINRLFMQYLDGSYWWRFNKSDVFTFAINGQNYEQFFYVNILLLLEVQLAIR